MGHEASRDRALVDAGSPLIVPVVHTLAGRTVVFRSPVGSKLDAAERGAPAAFEIDHHDVDGEVHRIRIGADAITGRAAGDAAVG